MIKDILKELESLDQRIEALENPAEEPGDEARLLGETGTAENAASLAELEALRAQTLEQCRDLTPADRVFLARHQGRPRIDEYIDVLFTDFFEQRGDRYCSDDTSIYGGIARYKDVPVTVIGHRKGSTLDENMRYRFGMPEPDGYRKALRLMRQAEKFGRPVITFIDTPGAYPGKEAEERGQAEAIARNLAEMSSLSVPVICVVTGEGSSGGALALGVGDAVLMLQHAVYAVLSPEGFASILWKDSSRWQEAAGQMKLTAPDLLELGLIDGIVPEPAGGAHTDPAAVYRALDKELYARLHALCRMRPAALTAARFQKLRAMGNLGKEQA